MDEPDAGAQPDPEALEPRPPLEADLAALCRELNERGARYPVTETAGGDLILRYNPAGEHVSPECMLLYAPQFVVENLPNRRMLQK